MNLKDKLKKRSEASGREEITVEKPTVEKVGGKAQLGALLKNRSAKKAAAVVKEREDAGKELEKPFDLGDVPKWSFSSLRDFEACPYRVYLSKVQKEPQKEQEADVGADRGSKIHDHLEKYVCGEIEDLAPNVSGKPWKLELFESRLKTLRTEFVKGKVQVEEDWGIRSDWSPCSWQDADLWGRAKLDVFVRSSETSCKIIDYKTGRKFGNELKHSDQALCYALYAMHRYPELDYFDIQFWYLDQPSNNTLEKRFTRNQLMLFLNRYHKRAVKMTSCTAFPEVSNSYTCQWCPYGAGRFGTGACEFKHE